MKSHVLTGGELLPGFPHEVVARIAREWPDGLEVNEANLLRAATLGLNFSRVGLRWLPAPFQRQFKEQTAPFWTEYDRQGIAIQMEFNHQLACLAAEYQRQSEAIRVALARQIAAILWRLMPKERP